MSAARARVLLEIDGLLLESPHKSQLDTSFDQSLTNGKENIHGVVPSRAEEDVLSSSMQRMVLSDKTQDDRVDEDEEAQGEYSGGNVGPASEAEEGEDSSSDTSSDAYSDEEDSDEGSDSGESEDEEDDRAECEAEYLAAEKLLSRTLALANSDPELGMAADIRASIIYSLIGTLTNRMIYRCMRKLAPTQTHILLRAPRRFAHPAWIPRPNLTRDMDAALREFEDEYVVVGKSDGGLSDITNVVGPQRNSRVGQKTMAKKKGLKTDCVRVRCSTLAARPCELEGKTMEESTEGGATDFDDGGDEMIWWSWDGRLEGFSW